MWSHFMNNILNVKLQKIKNSNMVCEPSSLMHSLSYDNIPYYCHLLLQNSCVLKIIE
jgi:hypothetical protein